MRLLYLSPVPWNSFAQRPHKFVEWFHARTGAAVLWVDPYPTRLPAVGDLVRLRDKLRRRGRQANPTGSVSPEWISVLSPRAIPVEPLPGAGLVNRPLWSGLMKSMDDFVGGGPCVLVVAKPSELAVQALRRYRHLPSWYDAMDDFPAFYEGLARAAMERREGEVASLVSRLSVSSTALAERFAAHRGKLEVARNACAMESLPAVSALQRNSGDVVLGYVGTIGKWFDWQGVMRLAKDSPSAKVRLVGPVYIPVPNDLPPNVELHPACSHADAIRAMQGFTAGLIPFRRMDLTRSVDPIKYYEYRALGLPVISSRFGEMEYRCDEPGVFILDENTSESTAALVAAAARFHASHDEIARFRHDNCWEARFDALSMLQ